MAMQGGRGEMVIGRDTRVLVWKPSCASSRNRILPLGRVSARNRYPVPVKPDGQTVPRAAAIFGKLERELERALSSSRPGGSGVAAGDAHRKFSDGRWPFWRAPRPDRLGRATVLVTLDDAELRARRGGGHHRLKDERPLRRVVVAATAAAAVRVQTHHGGSGEDLSVCADELRDVRRGHRAARGRQRLQAHDVLHLERAILAGDSQNRNDRLGSHLPLAGVADPARGIRDVFPRPEVGIHEVRRPR